MEWTNELITLEYLNDLDTGFESDPQHIPEDCFCCMHGHPNDDEFYLIFDESDICTPCNAAICQFWHKIVLAVVV